MVAIVLWSEGLRLGTVVQATSFAGLSIFLVALILGRSVVKQAGYVWSLVIASVVAAAVWLFSFTTFTGYGRLILVALALLPAILVSGQNHRRRVKGVVVLGVAPALIVFAQMRQVFAEREFGVDVGLSGIGSVVSPLTDFGRLLAAHDMHRFSYAGGRLLLALCCSSFPVTFGRKKPVGFGAKLTEIIYPELVSIGQSVAALTQGEWYYNFGWPGLVVMVPLMAFFISWLDARLPKARATQIESKRQFLWLVAALLMVCDVPNLLWVGSFGYFSRTVSRVSVVMLLMVLTRRRHERPSGDGASRAPNLRVP